MLINSKILLIMHTIKKVKHKENILKKRQMDQYEEAKNTGANSKFAQYLDTQFKQFDADLNTQTRCVWQLIQNAKDTKNRFNSVKIKQQLNEDYFISSHNGDAFTMKQLNSIVDQLSTKKKKNSEEIKTTGKYGTGFLTTYIIGRTVQLTGILAVDRERALTNLSQIQMQDLLNQNEKINEEQINAAPLALNECQNLNQKSQLEKAFGILKNKLCQKPIFYKRFHLKVDRSYLDRDADLPEKISKVQNAFKTIIIHAQYQLRHNIRNQETERYLNQRTVNQFGTTFKYKIQNRDIKIPMIQNFIQNVRQLICYSMLFNEHLNYYQFIDTRKTPKNISFSVQKQKLQQRASNIYRFKYLVKSQYNHCMKKFEKQQIKYLFAYFNNKNCLAAIPADISQANKIKILRVNQKYSQLFKDFPLIGSSPLKWNAVINSSLFYPNQKRSSILLKPSIHNENSIQQVVTNRKQLNTVFQALKNLYIFISQYSCDEGKQNFLIFNQINALTSQYQELKLKTKTYITDIINVKFIPNQNTSVSKTLASLKQLVFIEITNKNDAYFVNRKQQHKSMSKKSNQIFGFLFNKDFALSQQCYNDFYSVLNYQSQWRSYLQKSKSVTFVSLHDCLKKLEDYALSQSDDLFANNFQKLHKIYAFLDECGMSQIQVLNYKIYLNKQNQFKSFSKDNMMFKSIPCTYQLLALYLDIKLNHFIINQQFNKHFSQKKSPNIFDIEKFNNKIHEKYTTISQTVDKHQIQLLYRFLITFELMENEAMDLLKKFILLENALPFKFANIEKISKLPYKISLYLQNTFKKWFKKYFQNSMIQIKQNNRQHIQLSKFMKIQLTIKSQDESIFFLKGLFKNMFIGQTLCEVQYKLAWNKQFKKESQLKQLAPNVEYPNEKDIKIFDYLNLQRSNLNLSQMLVYQIYPRISLLNIRLTNYKQLYQAVKYNYKSLQFNQKAQVLNYLSQINDKKSNLKKIGKADATVQQRFEAWKAQINQRLNKLFDLKKQLKLFQNQDKKQFLYDLLDDEKQFSDASEIYKRKGNQLYFDEILNDIKANPQKKIKLD